MSKQIIEIKNPESNNIKKPDIVFLQSNGNHIIPVTTAEAVVWNDGTSENPNLMSLRQKINTIQNNPNQGGPTYTPGEGININKNEISVDPAYIQELAGKLTFKSVKSIAEVTDEGVIYLIKDGNEYKEYIKVDDSVEQLGSIEIDQGLLQQTVNTAVNDKTKNLQETVDNHTQSINGLTPTVQSLTQSITDLTNTTVKAEATGYEISYDLDLNLFEGIYKSQS